MTNIIYEVNITLIDPSIRVKHRRWLKKHVAEMLEFEGFEEATILTERETDCHSVTVHYKVKNASLLKRYLTNHATRMRADGEARFGGQFRASRRIFAINSRHMEKKRRNIMDFKIDTILNELQKFKQIKNVKQEVLRLTAELKGLQEAGSSQARQAVQTVEKRYNQLLKQFGSLQKQLDKEFSKALKTIDRTKKDIEKVLKKYKKKATSTSKKVSKKIRKKVAAKIATARTTKKAKKKVAKKAAAKKITRKTTKKVVKKSRKKNG